jgi:hypothetical protein
MKNLAASSLGVLLLMGLAAGFAETACSSACLRQTDCGSGEKCVSGTCTVVAVRDGSTVDGMTGAASSTTTPSSTSTAPTASATASAVPPDAAPPDAAPTFTPEAGYSTPDF